MLRKLYRKLVLIVVNGLAKLIASVVAMGMLRAERLLAFLVLPRQEQHPKQHQSHHPRQLVLLVQLATHQLNPAGVYMERSGGARC